jgi:glyoxylase-like metal-dependent hydrolase (beta-lactamase superfamily II)
VCIPSLKKVHTKRVNAFIHLIDLKPRGFENFCASYVIKGKRVAIVETGPRLTVKNLLAGLKEIGIKRREVNYVAVTHIHIDHAGGAGTLLPYLPNARLLVHEIGICHLVDPEKLWTSSLQALGDIAKIYGEFQPVPERRVHIAKEGMIVDLGEGVDLKVLEMPGHASHELSFFEKNSQGVFPGDAAGIYLKKFNVIIPTTPPPFHLEMTLSSLRRLAKMKPKRLYYSHFGPTDYAVKKLEDYAARLSLWGKIILEGMKDGEEFETIFERISEKDPLTPEVEDYIKNNLLLTRGIMKLNVTGFLDHFQKIYDIKHS